MFGVRRSVVLFVVAMFAALLLVSPVFASITVKNSSFENDSPTTWPFYCSITDWAGGGTVGVNTSSGPFADNGNVPDGEKVAFIQGQWSLSQSIDGFEAGKSYMLSYRENARTGGVPIAEATLGSQTVVASHSVDPTYGNYYVRTGLFTAPESGAYTLEIKETGPGDVTLLIDDVKITPLEDAGKITGKVVDVSTGSPIAGVSVLLDGITTATADANGNYSFDLVLPGVTHELAFSSGSYSSKVISVDMPNPGITMTVDATLFSLSNVSANVVDTFSRSAGSDLGTTESTGTIQLPWVKSADAAGVTLAGDSMEMVGSDSDIGAYLGGNFAPADFEISVGMMWGANSINGQWAGIAYRQPSLNYTGGGYYVCMNNDGQTVTLKRGSTVIKSATVPYTDNYNYFHIYKIRALGGHHQVWLDDSLIIDVYDYNNISGGYVGFICDGKNDVLVDDVNLNVYNAPSWIMTGKVMDSATSQPVPGAKVTVSGCTGTTDSNGVYSVTISSSDVNFYLGASTDITWTASARGYKPSTYSAQKTISNWTITQDLSLTPKTPVNIGDVRSKADGSAIYIQNAVVTGKYNGYVYIEDKDRVAGIKVKSASVALNDDIDIDGTVATENGEKYIDAVDVVKYGTKVLMPLGTPERAISNQGLSVAGLLMKTWGKVTYKDPEGKFMYIDDGSNLNDGSGHAGLKVAFNDSYDMGIDSIADVDDNISVVGVIRYEASGNGFPVVCPRSGMDIANALDTYVISHPSDLSVAWDGTDTMWESDVNYDSEKDSFITDMGLRFVESERMNWNQTHFRGADGTLLSDLKVLRYGEFVNSMSLTQNDLTLSIKLWIDTNDDGESDQFLIFEPWRKGFGGVAGTWQTFDALNDGKWWSVAADWSSILVTSDNAKPLSDYIAEFPNAKISSSYEGSLIIWAADLGAPSACFDATLGSVTVGTSAGTKVYTFSPISVN